MQLNNKQLLMLKNEEFLALQQTEFHFCMLHQLRLRNRTGRVNRNNWHFKLDASGKFPQRAGKKLN